MAEVVIKTSWKAELPQLGVIAAMFAWSALLWPSAPDTLPVHFDLSGNVDRMGGKLEGLFALPTVALGVYLLMRFLPRLDPARANYPSFSGTYATIRFTVLIMLAVVDLAVLLPLAGVEVDRAAAIRLIFGGFFMALGAFMGKIRPNWVVGIRTPWTLASKESWVKTHRMGGWMFILTGLALIGSLALPATPALVMSFGAFALGLAWIVIYSYIVWRKDPIRYPAIRTRPARDEPSERT